MVENPVYITQLSVNRENFRAFVTTTKEMKITKNMYCIKSHVSVIFRYMTHAKNGLRSNFFTLMLVFLWVSHISQFSEFFLNFIRL